VGPVNSGDQLMLAYVCEEGVASCFVYSCIYRFTRLPPISNLDYLMVVNNLFCGKFWLLTFTVHVVCHVCIPQVCSILLDSQY
jgi:hypothetical protein